jgi:hypothetical protein
MKPAGDVEVQRKINVSLVSMEDIWITESVNHATLLASNVWVQQRQTAPCASLLLSYS